MRNGKKVHEIPSRLYLLNGPGKIRFKKTDEFFQNLAAGRGASRKSQSVIG
jgi:hypothetical protein